MPNYPEYNENREFNSAYWLSQPPQVRSMSMLSTREERAARAWELASSGMLIDGAIHVDRFDPYYTMLVRAYYGYTWVPSYLQQPISVAPHVSEDWPVPEQRYDQLNPPKGSINVSVDIKDYPPFDPPVEVKPEKPRTPGPWMQIDSTRWHMASGDASPSGTEFSDSRGKFVVDAVVTPFATTRYWRLVK